MTFRKYVTSHILTSLDEHYELQKLFHPVSETTYAYNYPSKGECWGPFWPISSIKLHVPITYFRTYRFETIIKTVYFVETKFCPPRKGYQIHPHKSHAETPGLHCSDFVQALFHFWRIMAKDRRLLTIYYGYDRNLTRKWFVEKTSSLPSASVYPFSLNSRTAPRPTRAPEQGTWNRVREASGISSGGAIRASPTVHFPVRRHD